MAIEPFSFGFALQKMIFNRFNVNLTPQSLTLSLSNFLFLWAQLQCYAGADQDFFLSSFQFFYCNIRVSPPGGHFLDPHLKQKSIH